RILLRGGGPSISREEGSSNRASARRAEPPAPHYPWARGLKNKNLNCDKYHFFMREKVSHTLSVRALPERATMAEIVVPVLGSLMPSAGKWKLTTYGRHFSNNRLLNWDWAHFRR